MGVVTTRPTRKRRVRRVCTADFYGPSRAGGVRRVGWPPFVHPWCAPGSLVFRICSAVAPKMPRGVRLAASPHRHPPIPSIFRCVTPQDESAGYDAAALAEELRELSASCEQHVRDAVGLE